MQPGHGKKPNLMMPVTHQNKLVDEPGIEIGEIKFPDFQSCLIIKTVGNQQSFFRNDKVNATNIIPG